MKEKERKPGCGVEKNSRSGSEQKGYGAYQQEIKGGNIGPIADEGATGDAGIAVGGGLGVGKNSAGISDNSSQNRDEINEDVPRPDK